MLMGAPLWPLVLIIQTPHGTVDFAEHMPDPNALRAVPVREVRRDTALSGLPILSTPDHLGGYQLRLSIPDITGVALERALPLQACRAGERVTITENLTRRDTVRVWTNAQVISPDSGNWIAGNARDGDYASVVMEFFSAAGG
ncbi:hypothetical protein DM785_02705 [Deinococcus actinosclerus]|nr:hypothetical protein DM785_02705 [Deinococcus actinosclerus]